jgi:hypothetical protein
MRSILAPTVLLLSLFTSFVLPASLPPQAQKAYKNAMEILEKRPKDAACNKNNVIFRKEWYAWIRPPSFSCPSKLMELAQARSFKAGTKRLHKGSQMPQRKASKVPEP